MKSKTLMSMTVKQRVMEMRHGQNLKTLRMTMRTLMMIKEISTRRRRRRMMTKMRIVSTMEMIKTSSPDKETKTMKAWLKMQARRTSLDKKTNLIKFKNPPKIKSLIKGNWGDRPKASSISTIVARSTEGPHHQPCTNWPHSWTESTRICFGSGSSASLS